MSTPIIRWSARLAVRAIVVVAAAVFFGLGPDGAVQDAVAQDGATQQGGAEPRSGILSLHVGRIDTATLEDVRADLPERFEGRTRYVVQLDGPLDSERAAALGRIGIDLERSDYVAHFAYVTSLAGVDPTALAELDFLLFVGGFQDEWKLDAELGSRAFVTGERQALLASGSVPVVITLFAGEPSAEAQRAVTARGGEVHRVEPVSGNVVLSATLPAGRVRELVPVPSIQHIEDAPEIVLRNNSNRWIVQSNLSNVTPFYDRGIHGEDQVVGILDGRVSVNHCSFFDSVPIGPLHRKILAYNTSTGVDTHGTHVAGTAVGDGGSDTNTRGVAYLSKVVYNTIPSFTESGIRQRLDLHHDQGARAHTNSWGDDSTTSYNSLARGFDSFSHVFEDSLALLAVTNTSTLKNPENAKNLLAVGASDDAPNQGQFCSGGRGPTADGRRKPEIFAPGCSTVSSNGTACSTASLTGTSMACPAVAGTALLVRQYYADGYYPTGAPVPADAFEPSGALVKATLLNSAVDMTGIAGYPSNGEGWGRVVADDAAFFTGDARKLVVLDEVRNALGLSTGQVNEYPLEVLGSAEGLKITLVFTDAPASASTGTGFAAVNDLDLEVVAPTGDLFRGNVFSGGQSVPGGSPDIRNNVEQVHLDVPASGSWTVRVRAAAVNVATQGFALVATGDVTPVEPILRLSLPDGPPDRIEPGRATEFAVTVADGQETVEPGSPTLHYRFDGGTFQTAPLASEGGDLYTATLPAAGCADVPEFFLSATGDQGTVVTLPANAPESVFTAEVGVETIHFADDFEVDRGWTVENVSLEDGPWERAVPAGGGSRGDPPADSDGSGFCFVTDNVAGNSDVDGGPTRLLSPVLDLAGVDAWVRYDAWFSNDDGDDVMRVHVSPDGGTTWVLVRSIGPGGSGGWTTESFRVADFITPTSQARVRFEVADNPNNSVTEAGLDAVLVTSFDCDGGEPITRCGPGAVNVSCGAREDVLTVNGQTGGPGRTIVVATGEPLSFVLDEPSAESGDGMDEKLLAYVWFAAPEESDVVTLPKNLGDMCFGPKLVWTRPAEIIVNSIGLVNKAGEHNAEGEPPLIPDEGTVEFLSLPDGFDTPMDATVQGILPDACTRGRKPFSVSNGILIRVQ